jgi:hypothetical protein
MAYTEEEEKDAIVKRADVLHNIYTDDELSRYVIDVTITLLSAARDNFTKTKLLIELLGVTGNFFFSAIKSIDAKNN